MGTSAYTKERLEAAARGARTLTEALERLGVDPRSGSRRYLHDRMRKLGVDTSHFEREGVRWTREVLVEAVAASTNMCEVLRRLGVEVVGGQHTHISRRIKAYGIDVSHFPHRRRGRQLPRPSTEELRSAVEGSLSVSGALRLLGRADGGQARVLFRRWAAEDGLSTAHFLGQAPQRGKPGPTRPATEILVRHDGRRRTRTHLLRRALREVGVPEECAECGTGLEWLGKSITLEIDHINGDWSDDRRENLRLLCPNCHAATDTWCRGGRSRQGR
ncbi:HNH endonuclease signature motif containing protein [Streptomyces sp. NPDC020472]|uniref:HNH endonuclease signature motif containing protein n=1 Tax=Streptomyces sp. NPDC020472 TaxID=3365075 RepID=UPI0037B4D7CA